MAMSMVSAMMAVTVAMAMTMSVAALGECGVGHGEAGRDDQCCGERKFLHPKSLLLRHASVRSTNEHRSRCRVQMRRSRDAQDSATASAQGWKISTAPELRIALAHHHAGAGELLRQGLHLRLFIIEACGKCLAHVRRQSDIADHDRAFAGVDPRLVDGRIEVHAEIHRKGHELHHRRQDAAAAGGADRETLAVLRFGDDGRVVAEAALAGRERVGGARRRVEPHDAVVHGDAGVRRHVFRAEGREQRLRDRGDVAVAVDHGEMRGAGGRQIFGAERALAVGIAHVLEPLAEGRLQGRAHIRCRWSRRVRFPASDSAATGAAHAPLSVRP